MTRLTWGQVNNRYFETGTDRGVLYTTGGQAYPWQGLVGVDENQGGTNLPLQFDGMRYNVISEVADYSATLKAFTYPPQFEDIQGHRKIANGLYVGSQDPSPFNLSYRTRIVGNVDGYKIHLVYNVVADISPVAYETNAAAEALQDFSWGLSTVPSSVPGYWPTAHAVIDSTTVAPYLLRELEEQLYGTATTNPQMVPLSDLVNFVSAWTLFTVTDHGDGTWSVTGPADLISVYGDNSFEIRGIEGVYTDADSYNITTTT